MHNLCTALSSGAVGPSENSSLTSPLFVEALSAEEIHRRATMACQTIAGARQVLCFYLVEIEERELYRHFGCSSVYHYAEIYLNLAPHTIAEYLRSGKDMKRLPRLAAACARGEI